MDAGGGAIHKHPLSDVTRLPSDRAGGNPWGPPVHAGAGSTDHKQVINTGLPRAVTPAQERHPRTPYQVRGRPCAGMTIRAWERGHLARRVPLGGLEARAPRHGEHWLPPVPAALGTSSRGTSGTTNALPSVAAYRRAGEAGRQGLVRDEDAETYFLMLRGFGELAWRRAPKGHCRAEPALDSDRGRESTGCRWMSGLTCRRDLCLRTMAFWAATVGTDASRWVDKLPRCRSG